MKKFTDAYVKSLKPKERRYVVREEASRGQGGFCIRVTPNCSKSWYLVFSHPDRLNKGWCHLGDYPAVSLSRAREKFRQMKEVLSEGKDPIVAIQEQKTERKDAWTIDKLCDEFLEKYSRVKKRPRSAKEDELNLKRDVRAIWGKKKAKDISRGDVVSLLDEIMKRGAGIQANRTLATVRKMFNWALEREVVQVNPAAGVGKPATETPKERALSSDEIKEIWKAIDVNEETPNGVKKAIKMVLLTGCRPGEITAAQWDQLDGKNWLLLPGTSTKNKKPHKVYLSTIAKQVIGPSSEGLIISKEDGSSIPVYALSFWVRRCNYFGVEKPWSPHDLRRTCATKLAELGTAPHLIQRILNHVQTGITGRVYDQHTYADEISMALEKWGQSVDMNVNGKKALAKVINYRGRKN
jgi:integrase